MSNPCIVSIITPAYNAEKWLPRLIDSILAQTMRDFEWIVVDDCSSDGTLAVIREAAEHDPRVRPVSLPKNAGVANARNEGLRVAEGKYVCFLDADDYWAYTKLAVQLEFMETNGLSVSCMDYYRVSDTGQRLAKVSPPRASSLSDMLVSNRIGNLTGMVKRHVLAGIRFQPMGHEDYVFWIEVVRRVGAVLRVPSESPLCFYTVLSNSLSANKLKAIRWQWHIYRKVLRLGLPSSTIYFIGYAIHALRKRS